MSCAGCAGGAWWAERDRTGAGGGASDLASRYGGGIGCRVCGLEDGESDVSVSR